MLQSIVMPFLEKRKIKMRSAFVLCVKLFTFVPIVFGVKNHINMLQMNIRKPFLLAISGVVLAGCASPLSKITSASLDAVPEMLPEQAEKISDEQLKGWPHQGLTSFPGIGLSGAYDLLKNIKSSNKVIVGVIDSGIDINHEDLKNVVWVNPNEIPNNNIDDDRNGYVDDVHGWNFLGDINQENMEITRIYKSGDKGNADYQRAKEEYEKEYEKTFSEREYFEQLYQLVLTADDALRKELKKDKYTAEDVAKIQTTDNMMLQYVEFMKQLLGRMDNSETVKKELKGALDHYVSKLNYHLNLEFNPRKEILKDDENDFSKIGYGNNNVIGPDLEGALHGTHVAGIIGAQRGNGIGMDGVANNIAIMAIRAVPDGDEYDKDIALAIRYAVDNGAKVINTSFGKGFSPHKEKVYEAIKYAASKDVLIVNAAGNDSKDIDVEKTYPNEEVDGKEISDNFLTVGALNYQFNENLIASFSNYGKRNVDVFAPGVKIWATAPDNAYKFLQGTSMASPEVAGLAALIRSYFPNLTASQVKKVIMQSGVTPKMQVYVGEAENRKKVEFSELSSAGTMVNARNAVILAAKMSQQKKK